MTYSELPEIRASITVLCYKEFVYLNSIGYIFVDVKKG